jgi:hypothetical protein
MLAILAFLTVPDVAYRGCRHQRQIASNRPRGTVADELACKTVPDAENPAH